jgi:CheY-like chemotaxis protein
MKILLVDDDPHVLSALRLLLEALGHSVVPCTEPEGAIEVVRAADEIDLVLCDLKMPGMSGLDVLRIVKEERHDIPFVLMSGHATAAEVKIFQQLGGDDFLGKPFTPEHFLSVLTKLGSRTPDTTRASGNG